MSRKLRVALVDPSPSIRQAVASYLQALAGVDLVRQAERLADLEALPREELDVIIADLQACTGPCRGDLQALRERFPHMQLIVITLEGDREYEEAAMNLAADGWVPKARIASELEHALRKVTA